jgi:hypothetical protein
MMTRSYLFAGVTAALLLVLVVPQLNGQWWTPSELPTISALFVVSMAAGGLTSELSQAISTGRKKEALAVHLSGTKNARKYFMPLTASLLLLVAVVPSIQSAVASRGSVVGVTTVAILFVLSLALAGLATHGLFALVSRKKSLPTKNVPGSDPTTHSLEDSASSSISSLSVEIDSRFKALDATLDARMQELKLQLLGAIHDAGLSSADLETDASVEGAPTPSAKTEATERRMKVQRRQPETPTKDQVVEALLGRLKAGGN